jgi:hypothetical protein
MHTKDTMYDGQGSAHQNVGKLKKINIAWVFLVIEKTRAK